MSELYEALSGHPALEQLQARGIDDVAKLADQYAESQKFISSNRKGIPDKGSSDEEWAAFRKELGVPDTHEAYSGETEYAKAVREAAHGAGLTPEQFDAVTGAFGQYLESANGSRQQDLEQLHEHYVEAGKKQFGADYESRVAAAKRVFDEALGGDEKLRAALDETGLSSHPAMIELLSKVHTRTNGAAMPEDSSPADMTADQKDQQIVDLIDKAHAIVASEAFQKPRDPGYKSAVTEYTKIQQRLRDLGLAPENPGDGILSGQKAKEAQIRVRGYSI